MYLVFIFQNRSWTGRRQKQSFREYGFERFLPGWRGASWAVVLVHSRMEKVLDIHELARTVFRVGLHVSVCIFRFSALFTM